MQLDVIVMGGGLAGSVLADQLGQRGHRVLMIEREARFKDRVRGENMLPWGVAAARRLGILDDLIAAGGHQPPNWAMYMFGNPAPRRDFRVTTPHGVGCLNIYHPDMQEALLRRALGTGVEVWRGATVVGLETGSNTLPRVVVDREGRRETITARIVVGADGRASLARSWAGFDVKRNPDLLTIAGTLLEGVTVPDDAVHLAFGPGFAALIAPLGGRRARSYFVYPGIAGRRKLSGKDKVAEFLDSVRATMLPASWLENAASIGPLAEFEAADHWVDSPARNGVALVGDAAACSDPSWGCGLSLSLLDVECLTNALISTDDWGAALTRYAREHDEYFGALHRQLAWMTELTWSFGPEADARRGRVFPRMQAEPQRFPDPAGLGPFGPSDETARRLTLGLDEARERSFSPPRNPQLQPISGLPREG